MGTVCHSAVGHQDPMVWVLPAKALWLGPGTRKTSTCPTNPYATLEIEYQEPEAVSQIVIAISCSVAGLLWLTCRYC